MINLVRLRAISSNVSSPVRARSASIIPLYHRHVLHHTHGPSPRHLTSTTAPIHTDHSQSRNLNTIAPQDQPSIPTTSPPLPKTPSLKPSSSAPPHHNLQSYLTHHATRLLSTLDPPTRLKLTTSTVHLGTCYEYLIQSHLQTHLGFTLTRIGGKGDGGVDLIGTWSVPFPSPSPSSTSQPNNVISDAPPPTFRILLQAKRLAPHRKPMPALMRELDGTLHSSSTSPRIAAAFALHDVRTTDASSCLSASFPPSHPISIPTLGILVTTRPLTPGIEKAMASSRRCLMYICLEEVGEMAADPSTVGGSTGLSSKVRQMAWNAAAGRAGLEGYDVVYKYGDDDGSMAGEAVLMFQGRPLG